MVNSTGQIANHIVGAMQKANELDQLIQSIMLHHTNLYIELGVLAGCLLAGWVIGAWLGRHLLALASRWQFGLAGLARVVAPLSAVILVSIAQAVLAHYQLVALLKLARLLLIALVFIQLAIYMLRHIFAPSGLLLASERFIAVFVWILLALHITGLLPTILATLDDIGFTAGKEWVSLLTILEGLVSVGITILVVMWLSSLVENRVMQATSIDANVRVIVVKVIRAVLMLTGLLVALALAGINITALSIFGGALGVGVGLGLQRIASNYMSGFIILLDRSIHLGDWVTIDNRTGMVARLTARYTVVRGIDGTEAIIPNETLITSTVMNFSNSAQNGETQRLSLPLQISADNDLAAVQDRMAAILRQSPHVLADPAPTVLVRDVSGSQFNLEALAWLSGSAGDWPQLKSDLYLALWRGLTAAGIKIH